MSIRVHHIHLICSDLEQTEQFFIQKFGALAEGRTTFGGAPGSMLDFSGTKIYLRACKAQENISRNTDHNCYGYNHLGFQVEDLKRLSRELESSGVEFRVPPKETPSGHVAFLIGPDNILIELFQPKH